MVSLKLFCRSVTLWCIDHPKWNGKKPIPRQQNHPNKHCVDFGY
jgi:hypothetical protein